MTGDQGIASVVVTVSPRLEQGQIVVHHAMIPPPRIT
jgi:hypothetical protein